MRRTASPGRVQLDRLPRGHLRLATGRPAATRPDQPGSGLRRLDRAGERRRNNISPASRRCCPPPTSVPGPRRRSRSTPPPEPSPRRRRQGWRPGTAQTATIPPSHLQDQMTYHYRAPDVVSVQRDRRARLGVHHLVLLQDRQARTSGADRDSEVRNDCPAHLHLVEHQLPAIVSFGADPYNFKANAADVTDIRPVRRGGPHLRERQHGHRQSGTETTRPGTCHGGELRRRQPLQCADPVPVSFQAAAPPIADCSFDGPYGPMAADSASPAHPAPSAAARRSTTPAATGDHSSSTVSRTTRRHRPPSSARRRASPSRPGPGSARPRRPCSSVPPATSRAPSSRTTPSRSIAGRRCGSN